MAVIRALITFPAVSALPADVSTNTLLFGTPPGPVVVDDLNDIVTALTDHYSGEDGTGDSITNYMSPLMDVDAATVRFYDMADAEPRVPIEGHEQLALTPAIAGGSLPREVALCSSFHAATGSGLVAARRRGRIYIGPLGTNALDDDLGRPAAAFINAVGYAQDRLIAASNAAADWSWLVYAGLDSAEGTTANVVGGWVDNEFDTQRRRGLRPTTRFLTPA